MITWLLLSSDVTGVRHGKESFHHSDILIQLHWFTSNRPDGIQAIQYESDALHAGMMMTMIVWSFLGNLTFWTFHVCCNIFHAVAAGLDPIWRLCEKKPFIFIICGQAHHSLLAVLWFCMFGYHGNGWVHFTCNCAYCALHSDVV